MPIVVINEFGQDALQLPAVDDQDPVKALAPCCSHPSFGVRVRPRSQLHRMRTTGTDVSG